MFLKFIWPMPSLLLYPFLGCFFFHEDYFLTPYLPSPRLHLDMMVDAQTYVDTGASSGST